MVLAYLWRTQGKAYIETKVLVGQFQMTAHCHRVNTGLLNVARAVLDHGLKQNLRIWLTGLFTAQNLIVMNGLPFIGMTGVLMMAHGLMA